MASTDFKGSAGTKYADGGVAVSNCWHGGPTMGATGTLTGSRRGNTISGTVLGRCNRPKGQYDYPVYITISSSGGGTIKINGAENSSYTTKISGNWTESFNYTVDCKEATTITVNYVCGQPGGCGSAGGSAITYGLKDNSISFNAAYKKPTISVSTNSSISIYNQRRSLTIGKNESAYGQDKDESSTTTYISINNQSEFNANIGNGGGTINFTPSDYKVSDGQSYIVSIRRVHNGDKDLSVSTSTTLYTYRTPVINSLSIDNNPFSGIGNANVKWRSNARRWGNDKELDFKTYLQFSTDNNWFEVNDHKPIQNNENSTEYASQNITRSILEEHISIAQRSQEKVQCNLKTKRKNESSGIEAITSNLNLIIQYQPKYAPLKVTFRENDSTGKIIPPKSLVLVNIVKHIHIKWTYPDYVDRGVIDGYRIIIYDESDNKVKEYEKASNNLEEDLIIDSRDPKRGQYNTISIEAYYNKPDGSGKLYGPALKSDFIFPMSMLNKPVIAYPKNNTQWHNTMFRILFELPEDYDMDTYDSNIQNGEYRYRNVEIKINDTYILAFTANTENMTTNGKVVPQVFSTITLGYKTHLCIYPALLADFPIGNNYTMQIRVQKSYYRPLWSEWSDVVNLRQYPISFSVNVDDYILESHFNRMRNWSKQLYDVYPINPFPSDNKNVQQYDVIEQVNYPGIYNTILGIQSGINNYASYDSNKSHLKLNNLINCFESPNEVTDEYVTALADPRPNKAGRNYIQLMVDSMNKLY